MLGDGSDEGKPQKERKTDNDCISPNDSDEGVPVAGTRDENPHVRGGEPYDVNQEPLAPDFSLTAHQRERRRQTMRNRTAPHPLTSEQIDDHLIAAGWNVDRAYHRWRAEHMQALARVGRGERIRPSFNVRIQHGGDESEEEADGEEPQESDDFIEYPHDASSERERRRLAAFLWKLVEEARQLEGTVPLKRSEAVMLLREAGWDVIQARDLYMENQLAFDEFTESYSYFRGPAQLRSERDNRLARLIDLTGRRDIDSLQAHLRRHNFNFIAAAVAWQKSGIPAVNISQRPEVDAEMPVPDDVSWWSESPSDVGEGEGDTQENDVVEHGVMITSDRQGATQGVHDHTKMMIEYLRNGQYTALVFRNRNYRWSNEAADDLPEFDFNNQRDIYILNNWRREVFQRVTGVVTRPRSIPWLEIEDDFLYDLHRELWDDLIALHPDRNPQSFLPLPVPASRQREWARRLNEEFEGTVQDGSDDPRPHRTFGAINIRRHRVQRIVNDFRLERNDPHPKENEGKGNEKTKTSKIRPKSAKPPRKRGQYEVNVSNHEDEDIEKSDEYEGGATTQVGGKKRNAKPSKGGLAHKKPKTGTIRKK
jgi:hypothetical protein